MAVGAADLALFDLRFDPRPGATTARVGRNVGDLVREVVEFEDHDVGLSAIDARVPTKVCDDLSAHLGAPLGELP